VLAVAEGKLKDCQQSTATPDRTNERTNERQVGYGRMWSFAAVMSEAVQAMHQTNIEDRGNCIQ